MVAAVVPTLHLRRIMLVPKLPAIRVVQLQQASAHTMSQALRSTREDAGFFTFQ